MGDVKIGSVSHGTLRPEDLIPLFIELLEENGRGAVPDVISIKREIENEEYYNGEAVPFDMEWLFDELDELSPPYCYFGANIGDGSDFGWWVLEDVKDCVFHNDGGHLHGTEKDIPKDFNGEMLVERLDGSMTLYACKRGMATTIWTTE